MLKTHTPKSLRGADLRALIAQLGATPAQIAKFLRVTERSVFRWLAEDSAPFAVLAALWHETPAGLHATALDVGNEVAIYAGLANSLEDKVARRERQLRRLLASSDSGAANDPLIDLPAPLPLRHQPVDAVMGLVGPLYGHGGRDQRFAQVGADGGIGAACCHQLAQQEQENRAI